MATILVPATNVSSPTSWGSRASVKGMIQKIWKNYKSSIQYASKHSNIPEEVITSFIAVESGGNASAGGSGHITQGLMQWNRNYAKATLEKEYSKGRLTEGEKTKLAEYGIKFDANGKTRDITNADQLKPELNILIGAITLGQLIDTSWGTSDGKIHLDRVIAVYNAGAYGDTGKKARQLTTPKFSTPETLSGSVNSITRAYIGKMIGKDGAMDIIKKDGVLV
jgi:soluble lytic murein transglycosylase-like protein